MLEFQQRLISPKKVEIRSNKAIIALEVRYGNFRNDLLAKKIQGYSIFEFVTSHY